MLSWNVASWTWNGGGAIDHGIMAQSRRGLVSAAVRRYRTYDRDRFIVARLDAGRPSSRGSSGFRRVTSHGVPNTRQTRKATARTLKLLTYLISLFFFFFGLACALSIERG